MNAYAVSAIVNSITFSSLGIFVYLKNRERIVNRRYLIFCTAVGFWSYGYFLWQIADDSVTALFYCRCFMVGSIFITITFFDFVLALLDQRQYKRKILYTGYLTFSLFWLLNFTPLFVKGVSPKLFFKYWPEPGIAYHPFVLLWFFYCLYALYLLFIGYRRSSGTKRNQIKYVLAASIVGYSVGSTNYFLWYDILIPPFGNFLIPFYAFIISYAIVRHKLLDINIVFRKTLIYSLIIGSLFIFSVVILFVLIQFFGGFFPQKTIWLTLSVFC